MKVAFSYLDRQFADAEPYLSDLRELVRSGDFTLGKPVRIFEEQVAEMMGVPHVVGVNTGTDAIAMPLQMLGVGPGDEVITTPNTFVATVGAIVQTGATPVFVDSNDEISIDPEKIEAAITPRTKAIVPVQYTGGVCNMPAIMQIAEKNNLFVIEDACQSILGTWNGKLAGTWGDAGACSLHPLKNLNVWGDGGFIMTASQTLADKLRLFRNHGLASRDHVVMFGRNCRMQSFQAVIASRLIHDLHWITSRRIEIAQRYDDAFSKLPNHIEIPRRRSEVRHVFHLYELRVKQRNSLLQFLHEQGIDAKIHYPIPIHLQPAAEYLGYSKGDFPVAEHHCDTAISLPLHQHLSDDEVAYVIATVLAFYNAKTH
jgi:dTDP-4-amino-4,6-dideoxygalactose transaminase